MKRKNTGKNVPVCNRNIFTRPWLRSSHFEKDYVSNFTITPFEPKFIEI